MAVPTFPNADYPRLELFFQRAGFNSCVTPLAGDPKAQVYEVLDLGETKPAAHGTVFTTAH